MPSIAKTPVVRPFYFVLSLFPVPTLQYQAAEAPRMIVVMTVWVAFVKLMQVQPPRVLRFWLNKKEPTQVQISLWVANWLISYIFVLKHPHQQALDQSGFGVAHPCD